MLSNQEKFKLFTCFFPSPIMLKEKTPKDFWKKTLASQETHNKLKITLLQPFFIFLWFYVRDCKKKPTKYPYLS